MKNALYVQDENIEDLEILEDLNDKINEALNEKFISQMNEIDWICNICDSFKWKCLCNPTFFQTDTATSD